MPHTLKALAWATVMIGVAFVLKDQGTTGAESGAIMLGLTGAAWASIGPASACRKGCAL
ncbi:MAG: hypothetical protein HRT64_07485 [Erythrobacter sp.]|nr:hypothetical protein [Erythrobacter sp.]